jgi:hypothetical protein
MLWGRSILFWETLRQHADNMLNCYSARYPDARGSAEVGIRCGLAVRCRCSTKLTAQTEAGSLRLDPGEFDHLGPLLGFAGDQLPEFGW